MRQVTHSMAASLDGYVAGPDGTFNWTVPDEEVVRLVTEEIREGEARTLASGVLYLRRRVRR